MADPRELELVQKVKLLVNQKFGGDPKRAFDHYADKRKMTGMIDRDELIELLKDADVGNPFTRGAYANGIMERFDKNRDGFISWTDFQKIG